MHASNALHASSRTATKSSRVPALTMADLTPASSRPSTVARDGGVSSTSSRTPTKTVTAAAATEQTTVRVGALIVNRGGLSPRPGQSTFDSTTSSVPSPYTASPVGSPHLAQTSPFGPNVLTVYEPCDLFDLHHALQHRLIDELGWSLHWYLDTETEIQQLELAKELGDKAAAAQKRSSAEKKGDAATPTSAKSTAKSRASAMSVDPDTQTDSVAAAAAVTPQHSDPNTPQNHRVDAQGRQLPYVKQKSQFGVMSTRFECSLCHELAAVRRSAFAFTPRSRLSRSPYEFRLASLRRWLRKRSTESVADALLATCLSVVVERYLAYLGFADCWTSLFVTAGLPVLQPIASTTSPTASREQALRFPTTLSSPTRFDRVPLSFYVLPALCRWKALKATRVEKVLRTAAVHPFPLSTCFPAIAKRAASTSSLVSMLAASCTFFAIQQQSYLPDKRRSSSRRNQMASLGESCVCDVYLVAANTPSSPCINAGAAGSGSSAEGATAASIWGYVQRDTRKDYAWSSSSSNNNNNDGSADEDGVLPTGELFYIASSLENYLRLGIVFGWVYGWQMCFSTAGPPSNSVPWLQWMNASAYEAALAANSDTAP